MDAYIIQRIALYVKDPIIVKLFFYIPQYRDLINTSDYSFDQLVLSYSNTDLKFLYTDNLKIIQSIYRLNIPFFSTFYTHLDWVASYGHLEIVKWLHENRTEGCTTYAMDWAAYNGHLETVKWLHENRTEGCTKYAINNATNNGHLEIVKYIRDNIKNLIISLTYLNGRIYNSKNCIICQRSYYC